MRACWSLLGVLGFALLAPQSAHAYIDPGTGSMLLQVVLAGILGIIFTAKRWMAALGGFFRRSPREGK